MWEGCAPLAPLCCRAAVLSETAANSPQLRRTALSCDPSALCPGQLLPAWICSAVWLYFKKKETLCCSWAAVLPPEATCFLCRPNPLLVSMFFRLSPASVSCMEKSDAWGHLATSKWGLGKRGITSSLCEARGSPVPFWSYGCEPYNRCVITALR